MEELGKYQWFQPVLTLNGCYLSVRPWHTSAFFMPYIIPYIGMHHIGIFIAPGRELNAQPLSDQSIGIIINTATIK